LVVLPAVDFFFLSLLIFSLLLLLLLLLFFRQDLVGLILVKELVLVDPEEGITIGQLEVSHQGDTVYTIVTKVTLVTLAR
jgi:hypothetical protein